MAAVATKMGVKMNREEYRYKCSELKKAIAAIRAGVTWPISYRLIEFLVNDFGSYEFGIILVNSTRGKFCHDIGMMVRNGYSKEKLALAMRHNSAGTYEPALPIKIMEVK